MKDSYLYLTQKIHTFLQTKWGLWCLGIVSFAESALPVPIVTDPVMVLYILANQNKALRAVIITTLTSTAGGVAAYTVAYLVKDPLLALFPAEFATEFYALAARAQGETFILTILGAVTPIPYTAVAVAVGFVEGSVWLFILASLLGRGARYGVVGYMALKVGALATTQSKRPLLWLTAITMLALIAYVLYKLFY
jgi:membrane protein YqaA with SNARE-associated domain